MEHCQEAITKPNHFRSCGSNTYELNRMNGHTDKVTDKLGRSHTNRDKISDRKLKQDQRPVHIQNQMSESQRYPFRQTDEKVNPKRKVTAPVQENPVRNNKAGVESSTQRKHTSEQPDTAKQIAQEEQSQESGDSTIKTIDGSESVVLIEKPGTELDVNREHHHGEGHNHMEKSDLNEVLADYENEDVTKFNEIPEGVNISYTGEESELASSSQMIYQDIEEFDRNLPSTVMLLRSKGGSKVYVVGTVHFSLESQKDVANLISAVRPNHLVLELCPSRAYMLNLNEEQILKEAQNLNFTMMRNMIRSAGVVQGGLHLLFLSMTIKITKQLGIAPGGEFRTAFREAVRDPNCVITFGDRPIHVTLHRMLASLSFWKITKLLFEVLFKGEKITMEEVEKCKNRDVLERMILGLSKELPELARVMVNERDQYLAYSLQAAAQSGEPNRVVGVVGIGHMAGIKENWGNVTVETIHEILSIPPPSRSSRFIKFTLKFTAVGLVLYGFHKIASRSEFYSNLFSNCYNWGWSNIMYDAVDMSIVET